MLSFDPHDPAHGRDGVPFDHLALVRRDARRCCPTPSGAWYLSRYALVESALKDVDVFRADLGALSGLGGVEDVPDDELFLSEIGEPRHGQIRRLFNSAFGPHRVAAVEPFVRATCDRLLDDMLAADVADLHGGYALQIPGLVMTHVMGLPPDTPARFAEWSMDGTIMQRPCSPGVGTGRHPLQNLFAEQLAARRALPEMPSDVFRTLSEAVVDGRGLTDQEICTQLHFMVQAGVHTTRGLLTHLVHRLLVDEALFARLRAAPELVPTYLEESLRHDAPVQRTSRRCTRPASLGGVSFDTGDVGGDGHRVGQPRRGRVLRPRRVPPRPSRPASPPRVRGRLARLPRARRWPASRGRWPSRSCWRG